MIDCVGNKSDLSEMRQISSNLGSDLAEKNGFLAFHETSAKTDDNVEDAVQNLVTKIVEGFKTEIKIDDQKISIGENDTSDKHTNSCPC